MVSTKSTVIESHDLGTGRHMSSSCQIQAGIIPRRPSRLEIARVATVGHRGVAGTCAPADADQSQLGFVYFVFQASRALLESAAMLAVLSRRQLSGAHADADPLYLSAVAWFAITFATFWIALLGHEAAHFAVAHFLYSPSELSTVVAPRDELLVVGAGPAFTLAMIVACAAASRALRQWRAIVIAAIAFAVSRVIVIAPATLLNRGKNDELTVGHILNVSPALLWIAEALVAVAALAFVAGGGGLHQRRGSVTAIAAAIVAGWLSAFTVGRAIGLPI
jgi:hypothetical protein